MEQKDKREKLLEDIKYLEKEVKEVEVLKKILKNVDRTMLNRMSVDNEGQSQKNKSDDQRLLEFLIKAEKKFSK